MFSPRPYGLLVLGLEPSQEDISFIESSVRSLTNIKTTSRLDSLKLVRTLPHGGYVVIQDMGGNLRVIVHKEQYADPEYVHDGLAHTFIPMLFSGIITKSVLSGFEGLGLKLSIQTRRRLTNYTDITREQNVELQRFKIPYFNSFKYFEPQIITSLMHTQYVKQKPTLYSGAMAEVMQIVGGYGKLDYRALPAHEIERAQFLLPEEILKEILDEIEGVRLPGYTGIPDLNGQFKFDYKFNKCNGISFDDSGNPWLLNIDRLGVYAMPLPIIPATSTAAFKRYIETKNDHEILSILERFKGLPSGETFPSNEQDFFTWVRAGVIIKICDTQEFYRNLSLYAASGWSFNSRGSEAFNTCYTINDNGLMEVYGYLMQINLAAAHNHGLLNVVTISDENSDKIGSYINSVNQFINNNEQRSIAIKYKLRCMTELELLERVNATSATGININEVYYLDNLVMNPIATHTAFMTRISSGYVNQQTIPYSMGALKFPNLYGTGCESLIIPASNSANSAFQCDTIMFGCYIDDQLNVVKYFHDTRKFNKSTESNFEEVMVVGSWEKTETSTQTGLMGTFYSSDFDDRQEQPGVTKYTQVIGRDLGYGLPTYVTPAIFQTVGYLFRERHYSQLTKTRNTSSFSIDIAICIPVNARDTILYAYKDYTSGTTETEKLTQHKITDPTSYQLWCYDFTWHWNGATLSGNKGSPRSNNGVPVYVDTMIYNPTSKSDFADSGNWFGLSPGGFIDVTAVCGPYTSRSNTNQYGDGAVIGGNAPSIRTYSKESSTSPKNDGFVNISTSFVGAERVHNYIPDYWYFDASPSKVAGALTYFNREICKVVFGSATYANISELNSSGRRFHWGFSSLVDHTDTYHFIGVINE